MIDQFYIKVLPGQFISLQESVVVSLRHNSLFHHSVVG